MNWLKRKWNWACEKPLFWWNLVLVGAVTFFTLVAPAPNGGDFRVRTLGMFLQLIGVLTVWLDLTATARHFGKAGFLRSTLQWLEAGLIGRNVVVSATGASLSIMGGQARGRVRTTARPDAPIDERVSNLESLTKQIDADLDRAYREIDERARELDGKMKAETAARASEIGDVKTRLEIAATGNYAKLAFGAVWLGVGVALATWAPEIAKIVNGQWLEVWRCL